MGTFAVDVGAGCVSFRGGGGQGAAQLGCRVPAAVEVGAEGVELFAHLGVVGLGPVGAAALGGGAALSG
ncbi:hypothetical protein AADG42_01930 [Ammonicoccus fulvus]|uniref:Uncharacterized protein n=1 Tax=Ammonicoccus fulvus TaxID=3138240 RepID=A0ABZ3FL52_9ACTN